MPEGSAQVLDAAVFRAEMERRGALHDAVDRYAQAYMIFLSQSVACNALHFLSKSGSPDGSSCHTIAWGKTTLR